MHQAPLHPCRRMPVETAGLQTAIAPPTNTVMPTARTHNTPTHPKIGHSGILGVKHPHQYLGHATHLPVPKSSARRPTQKNWLIARHFLRHRIENRSLESRSGHATSPIPITLQPHTTGREVESLHRSDRCHPPTPATQRVPGYAGNSRDSAKKWSPKSPE
jgi:hypothetical protein